MPDDPPKPPAGGTAAPSTQDSQHANRRNFPRYSLVASAEVTDVRSGARLSARISELSLKGCYVDTLNPFPEGTIVKLRILSDKRNIEAPARVIYQHAGFGMGVVFTDLTPDQRKLLETWLAELSV